MSQQDNPLDKNFSKAETLSPLPSCEEAKTIDRVDPKTLAASPDETQDFSEARTLSINDESVAAVKIFANQKAKQQEEGFPVANWEHYEFIKFLGEGGMGRVYKAKDPRLNRLVALKFLHGSNPEMIRRLIQEAQSQARISHKNVCKVYEVNKVQDYPYIAMQYIDGPSLKEAAYQLTITQKIKIIIDVALALHSAHREGIIHRDIKPANIMLEKQKEGDWCPYLMDFGLARDAEIKSNTVTGAIMGTPAYMPPEQARGDRNLDHRADIYSLGATLYDLLTEHPPFVAPSAMAVIVKVLNDEPIKLRKVNSSISQDLETIVMKCLEKEAIGRYGSAKELATDLQNYLDGEPISAHRASIVYTLRKKAKKHRALVTVSAIALLMIMGFAAIGINSRLQLAKQSRAAERFGERVKEIEAISRYSKMLPVHDTSPEKKLIQERIKEIEKDIQSLGKSSEGAGNYAIGKAYISLNNLDKAKEHLEKAWNIGHQTPETAYALGEILSLYFDRKFDEVKDIPDLEVKKVRLKELENNYKQPALQYLKKASTSSTLPTMYIDARLLLVQENYEESIRKAREAMKQSPWLYEANELIASTYITQANKQLENQKASEALETYQKAKQSIQETLNLTRSNARSYRWLVNVISREIEFKSKLGQPINSLLEEAMGACEKALLVDPDNVEAYGQMASLYLTKSRASKEPSEQAIAIQKALEIGKKALHLANEQGETYVIVARVYQLMAFILKQQNDSPIKFFDQAIFSYQKVLETNPNHYEALTRTCDLFWEKALYELKLGIDIRPTLALSTSNAEKLLLISPNNTEFINYIANALEIRAEYELSIGNDPEPWLKQAESNYQKIPKDSYGFPFAQINIGICSKTRGNYELIAGKDPIPSFNKSSELFKNALTTIPFVLGLCWLAETNLKAAAYELTQGQDIKERLSLIDFALEKALQLEPNNFEVYLRQAQKEFLVGQLEISLKRSPKQFFDKGKSLLDKSLQINPNFAETYQTYGEMFFHQLEQQTKTNAFNEIDQQNGLKMLDKALSINPKLSSAFMTKGYINLLKAKVEKETGKQFKESSERANIAFKEALKNNSLFKKEYEKVVFP